MVLNLFTISCIYLSKSCHLSIFMATACRQAPLLVHPSGQELPSKAEGGLSLPADGSASALCGPLLPLAGKAAVGEGVAGGESSAVPASGGSQRGLTVLVAKHVTKDEANGMNGYRFRMPSRPLIASFPSLADMK